MMFLGFEFLKLGCVDWLSAFSEKFVPHSFMKYIWISWYFILSQLVQLHQGNLCETCCTVAHYV